MSSMTLFILIVCVIAVLFLVINFIFAPHNPYQEKYSIFECGFHSFLGQNRTQFGIKFFIYALVYLLLDLEILLVYPFSVSGYNNDIYGLIVALIFIIIVTIGFVFELGKGALKIDSRQNIQANKINSINVTYISNNTETNLDTSRVAIVLNSSIISSNFFKKFTKYFTIVNIVTGIFGIFIVALFKLTPLAYILLTSVGISPTDLNQYILGGIGALIARLAIKGVIENAIHELFGKIQLFNYKRIFTFSNIIRHLTVTKFFVGCFGIFITCLFKFSIINTSDLKEYLVIGMCGLGIFFKDILEAAFLFKNAYGMEPDPDNGVGGSKPSPDSGSSTKGSDKYPEDEQHPNYQEFKKKKEDFYIKWKEQEKIRESKIPRFKGNHLEYRSALDEWRKEIDALETPEYKNSEEYKLRSWLQTCHKNLKGAEENLEISYVREGIRKNRATIRILKPVVSALDKDRNDVKHGSLYDSFTNYMKNAKESINKDRLKLRKSGDGSQICEVKFVEKILKKDKKNLQEALGNLVKFYEKKK